MSELTNAQKGYFKNSQVRNEDGTLKPCYRGGRVKGDAFDMSKVRNFGLYGKGFYFTDNINIAASYAENGILSENLSYDNITSAYLNCEKVFDITQPITAELLDQVKSVLQQTEDFYVDDLVYDYNDWSFYYRDKVEEMVAAMSEDLNLLDINHIAKATKMISDLDKIEESNIFQTMCNLGIKFNNDNNEYWRLPESKRPSREDMTQRQISEIAALKSDLERYPTTQKLIDKLIVKDMDTRDMVEELKTQFTRESLKVDKAQFESLTEVKKSLTFDSVIHLVCDAHHNHRLFNEIMDQVAKDCDAISYKEIGTGGCEKKELESVEHTCYVVLRPNAIKSIDNLYPTKSDNFKDNSQEYLKENLGKISFDEQIEVSKYIAERQAQAQQKDKQKEKDKSKEGR